METATKGQEVHSESTKTIPKMKGAPSKFSEMRIFRKKEMKRISQKALEIFLKDPLTFLKEKGMERSKRTNSNQSHGVGLKGNRT